MRLGLAAANGNNTNGSRPKIPCGQLVRADSHNSRQLADKANIPQYVSGDEEARGDGLEHGCTRDVGRQIQRILVAVGWQAQSVVRKRKQEECGKAPPWRWSVPSDPAPMGEALPRCPSTRSKKPTEVSKMMGDSHRARATSIRS